MHLLYSPPMCKCPLRFCLLVYFTQVITFCARRSELLFQEKLRKELRSARLSAGLESVSCGLAKVMDKCRLRKAIRSTLTLVQDCLFQRFHANIISISGTQVSGTCDIISPLNYGSLPHLGLFVNIRRCLTYSQMLAQLLQYCLDAGKERWIKARKGWH